MTILFLSRLFAPHIGGVETHLLEISKRLIAQKNRVIVVTELFDQSLPRHEIIDGIEVYRINVGKDDAFKKFSIWRELGKLQELFQQADIVHAHDVYFWYLPFRFLFPFKKSYVTFHGYETQVPPRKGAVLMRKMSELLSNGNICIGEFIKKWYGTQPTYLSYGGTTVKKDINVTLTNAKKQRIVFVGRLENDLGIKTYLQVLEKLKSKKISYTFNAYGDGSLRKVVEQYGTVHGFVKDIPKVIADADIVFVSSYLSMLDALASKKLVVAVFENELKKDYLLQSPFKDYIISGDNAEQLTNKITYFLEHQKEKEHFIKQGYAWSREQTWDKVLSFYKLLWMLKK